MATIISLPRVEAAITFIYDSCLIIFIAIENEAEQWPGGRDDLIQKTRLRPLFVLEALKQPPVLYISTLLTRLGHTNFSSRIRQTWACSQDLPRFVAFSLVEKVPSTPAVVPDSPTPPVVMMIPSRQVDGVFAHRDSLVRKNRDETCHAKSHLDSLVRKNRDEKLSQKVPSAFSREQKAISNNEFHAWPSMLVGNSMSTICSTYPSPSCSVQTPPDKRMSFLSMASGTDEVADMWLKRPRPSRAEEGGKTIKRIFIYCSAWVEYDLWIYMCKRRERATTRIQKVQLYWTVSTILTYSVDVAFYRTLC